jgi:hypothetical protein
MVWMLRCIAALSVSRPEIIVDRRAPRRALWLSLRGKCFAAGPDAERDRGASATAHRGSEAIESPAVAVELCGSTLQDRLSSDAENDAVGFFDAACKKLVNRDGARKTARDYLLRRVD